MVWGPGKARIGGQALAPGRIGISKGEKGTMTSAFGLTLSTGLYRMRFTPYIGTHQSLTLQSLNP